MKKYCLFFIGLIFIFYFSFNDNNKKISKINEDKTYNYNNTKNLNLTEINFSNNKHINNIKYKKYVNDNSNYINKTNNDIILFSNLGGSIKNANYLDNQDKSDLKRKYFQVFNNSESVTTLICPNNYKYAINFFLDNISEKNNVVNLKVYKNDNNDINVILQPDIFLEGYTNSCVFNGKPDLFYGNDMIFDSYGKAENLSGFIPRTETNCNDGISSKKLIPISFNYNMTIERIFDKSKENNVIGFTESSNAVVPDCNKICNTMLDNYCNADPDMGYCGEIVLDSFFKTNKKTKPNQYFCSCKIKNLALPKEYEKYSVFTNAVDVSEIVNFSIKINNITCSNMK